MPEMMAETKQMMEKIFRENCIGIFYRRGRECAGLLIYFSVQHFSLSLSLRWEHFLAMCEIIPSADGERWLELLKSGEI